jgi:Arc-like DNA binding domain
LARKPPELRPVMVRLPEKLRRQLAQLATFYGRSMNAEIIYRLEQSLIEDRAQREYWQRQAKGQELLLSRLDEALLRAVEKMERAGFKIAKISKTADETEDGEKK